MVPASPGGGMGLGERGAGGGGLLFFTILPPVAYNNMRPSAPPGQMVQTLRLIQEDFVPPVIC